MQSCIISIKQINDACIITTQMLYIQSIIVSRIRLQFDKRVHIFSLVDYCLILTIMALTGYLRYMYIHCYKNTSSVPANSGIIDSICFSHVQMLQKEVCRND